LTRVSRTDSWPAAASTATRRACIAACLLIGTAAFAADEIHWTLTGPTSVTFDWRGSAAEGTIAFGATPGSYTTTVGAAHPAGVCVPYSSAGPFWEAKITGLSADTVYHYAIAGGPDHTFRTPPPPGTSSFDVLVEGDIGDSVYYPTVTGVQQRMAQETGARFALMVGDLTYADDHGQSHADQHFNDVMAWSRDVAYMPAWGNHEWDSEPADDLRNYKGRFDFPNPQTSVGTPTVSDCGEDWYWFDYGNVRFIAYPEPWTGAWADWNDKATALMNAAQADSNIAWIVTFGHRPAYSTGHHSGDTTLQSYLGALGLSHSKYVLNLNGHSHDYERSFPQNGVTHVTVGTGGSSLETDGACLWLTCTQPAWSAVRYFHLGYLKLSFTPSAVQGSFVCGPAGAGPNDVSCTPGAVIDSFTLVPSVPVPTIYVDQANPQCTANGSGTFGQPFCTINDAVAHAVAGNTVLVRAGTYPEYVKVTKTGTSTQPIVITAEPGANVSIPGQFRGFEISGKSWITIRGFTITDTSSYGIYVANSTNVAIEDNHVSRSGLPESGLTRQGIKLSGVTDSVVSGNTTDHNTDAGISVSTGSARVLIQGNVSSYNARGYTRAAPGIDVRSGGNTIEGNICHDNEDSGIQVFGVGTEPSPNNLVVNNLSYDNGDHGIDVSSAGSQRIIGNTVYGHPFSGINVEGSSTLPSSGTILRNNISVDNAIGSNGVKGNIRVDAVSVPGTTVDYDLLNLSGPGLMVVWNGANYATLAAFVAATGQEAHGLEVNPQLKAPASGDFHLAPGSPAIDSADSGASGASDTDLEGQARVDDPAVANTGAGPRTYDDRGAFEHPVCGNGILETGEECDGTSTGNAVCASLGCSGGDPTCTPQCTLNYGTCTGCPVCGNGIKELGEDCDGSDLGGATCESLGHCSLMGGLACTASCRFNTAGCSCGDNIAEGGCSEVCDGSDLNGQSCVTQGFGSGTLHCRADCAAFDTSGCGHCGDGVRQAGEACDGADLGGATCSSQGCSVGTPVCSPTCQVDYANCSNCWGGTLYVDGANPACTNAGQGTAAAPFCTINGAAAKVVAGGTVVVAAATYPEYVKVLTSGTASSPITFKAAAGATVNVTGQARGFEISGKSWIVVDGFNVSSTSDYGIYVATSSNVAIQNNHVSSSGVRVSGSTKPGIYISATTDSLISGNTADDNSDSGIYVTSSSTNVTIVGNTCARNARGYTVAANGIEVRCSGNTLRGNICHDNEHSGILVQPFSGTTPVPHNAVVGNVTYLNGIHGIQLKYSDSSQIVGNSVYGNLGSGIDLSGASTQCLVANNIAVDNALNVGGSSGGNVRVETAAITGTTLDYDLLFRSQAGTMVSWNGSSYTSLAAFASAAGQEAHGLQGAPIWVAPQSGDFRLKVGSPAIDSADSSVSGVSLSDIVGTTRTDDPATPNTGAGPRTYDDRGAYEYPLDADHDGYASDEDCDDMNPNVNPGALEIGCDGIDNDCNPATPDIGDDDGDGVTCTSDCNDQDPTIYPGAPEVNDGKDNQCPGDQGYGIIDETSGDSGFHTPGSDSIYSWPGQAGATSYQAARASDASFTAGCQSAVTQNPQWTDSATPLAGQVFYYLNRPLAPFVGSWGTGASGAPRTVSCASP
jgi:parallel beta-helix repeat protein